ncbi:putative oxoglutarate/iron-dependent dioxygenase, glycerol-3-phosphate dehydrogenase, NAD-dependent [Plasmopara halstedii]
MTLEVSAREYSQPHVYDVRFTELPTSALALSNVNLPQSTLFLAMPHKVCLVGSGNWGSAIARIIGENTAKLPEFEPNINMWVFEEQVDGRKLTEIINSEHENVKYLPGYKLPENIIAVPDLLEAVRDADILIFCVPHQFLGRMLTSIKEQGIKQGALAVSLIKGIDFDKNGIVLVSDLIRKGLNIDCSVLMGANVANEVAAGDFCESTLGCTDLRHGAILRDLFNAPTFRVDVALDPNGVELCGALKNVVALGAGFCDGLKYGGNTKAAIIRIGLCEMKKFCFKFFQGIKEDTFFESCGIADLITTCFGGRNRKCAEAFVTQKTSWEELEKTMLNGQMLQGTLTSKEVYAILKDHNAIEQFPLFSAIYRIAFEGADPTSIVQLYDKFPGVYKRPFVRDYERLHRKFTKAACEQLDEEGFVVIDDCFGHNWASALFEEMQWLNDNGHYKPNKTQFALTQMDTDGKSQAFHFIKPHIFEVDLHDSSVRAKVPELDALFHSTEIPQALAKHLPQYEMQFSTSDRTLKLQRNAGHGGCFPCHYDNPGAPNKRKVTCLLYLNESWKKGDGGEVQLFPFLQQAVTVAPKMDRVVLFQSDQMLHRVLPSHVERYVLTIWLDGKKVNAPEDSQLRLAPSDLADWFGFLERLRRSPKQRMLSRGVYEEEYYLSLMECMQSTSAEGCRELLKSHETHLENVKRNHPLYNFIMRLRDVRTMNREDPVYLD